MISLFNGTIPLIAIQMSALKIGDQVALVFTKVLDELQRGLVDEDEDVYEEADRPYWEARATKDTVQMCDDVLKVVRSFDPTLALKYNKFYIGLARDGLADNFVVLKPKKDFLKIEPRLDESPELDKVIADADLDALAYDKRSGRYRIKVHTADLSPCASAHRHPEAGVRPPQLRRARRQHCPPTGNVAVQRAARTIATAARTSRSTSSVSMRSTRTP